MGCVRWPSCTRLLYGELRSDHIVQSRIHKCYQALDLFMAKLKNYYNAAMPWLLETDFSHNQEAITKKSGFYPATRICSCLRLSGHSLLWNLSSSQLLPRQKGSVRPNGLAGDWSCVSGHWVARVKAAKRLLQKAVFTPFYDFILYFLFKCNLHEQ